MKLLAKSCPPIVDIKLEGVEFVMYEQGVAEPRPVLARGPSSRKMSRWAFENGAYRVRHDYNLKYEI